MAAPQVHDATGKYCGQCKAPFSKQSFNITVTKSSHLVVEPGIIEKVKVCKTCANEYFSRGE